MRPVLAILLCALTASNSAVASHAGAASETATDPDEAFNKNLAGTIVLVTDAVALVEAMKLEGRIPLSFRHGPDERAPLFFQALVQRRALLSMLGSSDDPAREATRDELVAVVPALMDALSDLTNAYQTARTAGGWDESAKALAMKGYAAAQALPFDGSMDKVLKDPRFQRYLPHYYLEASGLVPNPAGFKLGVRTYVTESLFIISVEPGSLAEKLQLHDLDTVLEFNGKEPRDMDDLKKMIRSAAGRTVSMRAQRIYDEAREYQVAVPAKLGS